jgi:hypothetical protein
MDNNSLKADPHDHHDKLPKDVLNIAQDGDSFRDPLEVEKEKDPNIERLTPQTSRQDQVPGKKDA